MPSLESQILASAQALERLRAETARAISAVPRGRENSEERRRIWSAYRARHDELFFPGGTAMWAALLARDAQAADAAIAFLCADPRFFGSGYMKSAIWQRLKRVPLNSRQIRQLEEIALERLTRPATAHFWDMVRYARFRGTPRFWERVEELAQLPKGLKARWLLLAKQNHPVRRWVGTELLRRARVPGYVANFEFTAAYSDTRYAA